MFQTKQSKCAGFGGLKGALFLLCAVGIGATYSNGALAAGFATNFRPEFSTWPFNPVNGYCTFGNCVSSGEIGNADPTPFGESVVNIGGVDYFHVIVGDPATGFAMESYTRAAGLDINTGGIDRTGASFSPDGGGQERAVIGNASITFGASFFQDVSNSSNVFGPATVSGTGTQDPNHAVFRMTLTDPAGDMSLEVYKPFLDKKPRISQTVQDSQGGVTISSAFVSDERTLGYNDMSAAAPVINTLVMDNPDLPGITAADFEMSRSQIPDVTAGRYTYTPGTKWNTSAGWNANGSTFGTGTYTYIEAQGFNPLTFDWTTVFNYTDNAFACSNPQTVGTGTQTGSDYVREIRGVYGGSCPGHP